MAVVVIAASRKALLISSVNSVQGNYHSLIGAEIMLIQLGRNECSMLS